MLLFLVPIALLKSSIRPRRARSFLIAEASLCSRTWKLKRLNGNLINRCIRPSLRVEKSNVVVVTQRTEINGKRMTLASHKHLDGSKTMKAITSASTCSALTFEQVKTIDVLTLTRNTDLIQWNIIKIITCCQKLLRTQKMVAHLKRIFLKYPEWCSKRSRIPRSVRKIFRWRVSLFPHFKDQTK